MSARLQFENIVVTKIAWKIMNNYISLVVSLTIVMSIYVVDDGSVSSPYVFLGSSKSAQQRVEFDPYILTRA